MTAWPLVPGSPAAGHVTRGGAWHPGGPDNCRKGACTPLRRQPNRGDRVETRYGVALVLEVRDHGRELRVRDRIGREWDVQRHPAGWWTLA